MSRVIVITGAGAGLGRALARRLASEGEMVVLLGRTAATLEALAAEIGDNASAVACDVGSADCVRRAFETIARHHPRVDVLINNAGIYERAGIADATDDQIFGTFCTNLIGPTLCCRAVIPLMKSGGHIVNVSSEAVEMSFPGLALYQASKAGLERLSRSLYQELEPRGIRVTVLRAGKMFDPDPGGDLDAPVPQGGARGMPAKVDLAGLDISNVDNVAGTICRMIDMPDDLCAELVVLHGRRRQSGEAAGQSDFK